MNLFFVLSTMKGFSRIIHHNFPKCFLQKIRRNLHAITGSDGWKKALWQVHCRRTDSYIGGKWIVITCLFLWTFGWVPSDLLQDFWIDLATLPAASSRLSRLTVGRYKPSLHRSRAQPLRGQTRVNQGVRFVNLSGRNAMHMFAFSVFVFIQT